MDDNPFCQCGCGRRVSRPNNKYIHGHNSRNASVPLERRKKMSERMKGKTYEELYGEERSKEIKEKIGKKSREIDRFWWIRNKSLEEVYGEDRAYEMKQNLSNKLKNSDKLKDRKGKKNPGYKGAKDRLYSHYSKKLEVDENRENENGQIEVRCTYCGIWFVPKTISLDNRINALDKTGYGSDFYCSNECKKLCPSHYQVLWPKDYKPYDNLYSKHGGSNEVDSNLRKMVLERDEWTCQKCGSTDSLHCHHIDPKNQNPMFANDIDSCVTLCKECHEFIHTKIEGCKYHELKCI